MPKLAKDNTVGSREERKLTQRQEEILIGKLLGDGCLELNGLHPRLKVDHSQAQKEYVFWMYKEFVSAGIGKLYRIDFFDKRYNSLYTHWRFATRSLNLFDPWLKLFYQGKRKIIPENIIDILTSPLSLAIWYMDDGYRRRDCKGVYLCTSSYTLEEHRRLQRVLLKNFSLESKVHFAGGYKRLYIPAAFAENFCNKITAFVLPKLSYKLL